MVYEQKRCLRPKIPCIDHDEVVIMKDQKLVGYVIQMYSASFGKGPIRNHQRGLANDYGGGRSSH